jgi:hypothetical protein
MSAGGIFTMLLFREGLGMVSLIQNTVEQEPTLALRRDDTISREVPLLKAVRIGPLPFAIEGSHLLRVVSATGNARRRYGFLNARYVRRRQRHLERAE